jgi:hypothetical protein
MEKSSVFFSKGCPTAIKEEIKVTLQVERETLNVKYLGIPSDVRNAKESAFKYLRYKLKCG